MVKGLKAIVVLMLITAAFNLFLTPGTPIVKFWIFKITAEGAQNAILMAIRLTYLILSVSSKRIGIKRSAIDIIIAIA